MGAWVADGTTILRLLPDNASNLRGGNYISSPLTLTTYDVGDDGVPSFLRMGGDKKYGFTLVNPNVSNPTICGGVIGGGESRFCSKDRDKCLIQKHGNTKAWS